MECGGGRIHHDEFIKRSYEQWFYGSNEVIFDYFYDSLTKWLNELCRRDWIYTYLYSPEGNIIPVSLVRDIQPEVILHLSSEGVYQAMHENRFLDAMPLSHIPRFVLSFLPEAHQDTAILFDL